MRIALRRIGPVAAAAVVAASLVACSSASTLAGPGTSGGGAPPAGGVAPIAVLTSTNVWGDVATQVGGAQVAVTSLITDPSADPHSFEPNAQAQLALSRAALVVENGGGYDDYLQTMIDAADISAPVISAVQVSGLQDAVQTSAGAASSPAADGANPDFNEHVWYDLPTAGKVATRIADELTTIRPDQAPFFRANLKAFTDNIAGLTARVAAIKDAHGGAEVAITEPVPLYLTQAAGLQNMTPPPFSAAIEQGIDVPPTVLADTLALFTGKQVVLLVYNEQTSSPETEQMLTAAKDHAIAVVGVTETLPAGKDYLSWMDANITALAGAFG